MRNEPSDFETAKMVDQVIYMHKHYEFVKDDASMDSINNDVGMEMVQSKMV